MPYENDPLVPAARPSVELHCVKCGQAMRLVSIEPHPRFHNLDIHDFVCACGEDASAVVALI